ncbi:MAG: hypothetical protein ACF8QF_01770 [Phycisphaerales bacterium]
MRRISTTSRAWCLLLTYAMLVLARTAHAAAPAPEHADPAPATPVVSADCGPCDNPDHHHGHAHAHGDHCPVCQSLRAGADEARACPGVIFLLGSMRSAVVSERRIVSMDSQIVRHGARAPPVR